jgi:ketosteroid isomerase-like protein
VAQYIAALEGRSMGALKRLWPTLTGVQERAIQGEFDNTRSVQVRFTDPRITLDGDAATVTGTRDYRLVTQDGQQLSTVTRTTLTLRKTGEAWRIERIVHQPR